MAPVLERLVAVAAGVVLGRLLLRQVPLAVHGDSPHVRHIISVVFARILLGVLAQDLEDFAATIVFFWLICVGDAELRLRWCNE